MSQTQAPTATDFIQAEQHNRDVLAKWWTNADIHPAYPTDTETVVELLVAAEYDVTRDLVVKYLDTKVIPSPQRLNGRLCWMATDIVGLAAQLELRRKWKPLSRIHGHKLSQFERMDQLAKLNGQAGCFVDLDRWDISGLLALLQEESCDVGARCAIVVAIRNKLKAAGIEV